VTNPDTPKQAENILLIGSDKRPVKYQNASNAGQRSDTTILLHIAADRKSAVLVSIPRDTIVDIPSCQQRDGTTVPAHPAAMFNSAFSEAGAACSIKTVEQLTKIRIDHHIVIDFGGFKDMVNALGGVKICLPQSVNDSDSHLVLSKGEHVVMGKDALAYVRTRHGLGNGSDIQRIDRQQAFLGSMVAKIKSAGLLLRPDRLIRFLDAATRSVTTDSALGSLSALGKLAQEVKNINTKDVTFLTAPNQPYPADPNRVELKPSARTVWNALRYDQPLTGKKKPTSTSSPTPTQTGPPLKTAPEKIRVQAGPQWLRHPRRGRPGRQGSERRRLPGRRHQERGAPRLPEDKGAVRPRVQRVRPHPRGCSERFDPHRGRHPEQHARRHRRRRHTGGVQGRGERFDVIARSHGDPEDPHGQRQHLLLTHHPSVQPAT